MLPDIERELQYYESQFRNKVVYCNCDDPQTSNFYRYFAQNFEKLGLRKVIAACYKDGERDLFSSVDIVSGFYYEYNGLKEEKMFPTEDDLIYFKGNGDFRSIESINIPSDYDGLMGVPITFLHKFNPNQFEIVRFRKGDNGKDLSIKGVCPYFRILIRKKIFIGQ